MTDIALGIELPGVYDGIAVWLLRDGTLVNRFRQQPGRPAHRIKATDEWIANHGDTCRKAHTDMLDRPVTP
jgi:hypothetical protein